MKDKGKLHHDIKKLVIGISILSLIAFGVSLIWGFKIDFLIGTIIGLAFSCCNMAYLGYTISKSVKMSQAKSRRYLVSNYLLRYLIFGIIFVLSVYSNYISTLAVTLPLFYPRIVLAINLFFERKEEV